MWLIAQAYADSSVTFCRHQALEFSRENLIATFLIGNDGNRSPDTFELEDGPILLAASPPHMPSGKPPHVRHPCALASHSCGSS